DLEKIIQDTRPFDTTSPEASAAEIDRQRQEVAAKARATLLRLNNQYFVINETGQVWVAEWRRDPSFDNREVLDRFAFSEFKKLYLNRTIEIPEKTVTDKGEQYSIVKRNLAEWWLHHLERKQYIAGVVFDPSGTASPAHLNLWRGFSVEPKSGDWSLL